MDMAKPCRGRDIHRPGRIGGAGDVLRPLAELYHLPTTRLGEQTVSPTGCPPLAQSQARVRSRKVEPFSGCEADKARPRSRRWSDRPSRASARGAGDGGTVAPWTVSRTRAPRSRLLAVRPHTSADRSSRTSMYTSASPVAGELLGRGGLDLRLALWGRSEPSPRRAPSAHRLPWQVRA